MQTYGMSYIFDPVSRDHSSEVSSGTEPAHCQQPDYPHVCCGAAMAGQHIFSANNQISPLPPVMKSAPTEGCRPPSQLVYLQDLHSGRGLVGRSSVQ